MVLKIVDVFILFLGILSVCGEYSRPKNFPRCDVNDVNLNQCMLQATEDIRDQLIKGVPELAMLPITAYPISKIQFEQKTKSLSYKASLFNVTMKGLENYKFTKFDFVDNKFILKYSLPKLYADCKYEIMGKLLVVSLEGKGNVKINMTDMDLDITMNLKETTRNNIKYLDPVDTTSKITLKDVDLSFDGLFGGNPVIEEAALKVINDNKPVLIEEFTPALEQSVEKIVEEYAYNHILKIPYNELFITK